jgi:hypothetical protein
VDRAGPEDEWYAGRDQRPDGGAHARDAGAGRRLVGTLEHDERELVLADLLRGDERETVAGGTEHEIEGRVGAERVDQRRRVATELDGGEAVLQQRQSAVERAELERDRPGVDPGDARTTLRRGRQASPFAIS